MNPVTFNMVLERALKTYPSGDLVRVFDGWQTTPLFDYVTTYQHERAQLTFPENEWFELENVRLPFDKFRLAVAETAVPWVEGDHEMGHGTYRTNMIVTKQEGTLMLCCEINELWDRAAPNRPRVPLPLCLLVTHLRHDPNGKADGAYFYHCSMWVRDEWIPLNFDTSAMSGIQQIVSGSLGALAVFLLDANLPTTHIAEIKPTKKHKSVEWTRARTHYTLITHGHPANRKDLAERTRVVVSRDDELKRMSHDRRGHWRTYRHERYTYARGSTRWIKQAWCGPKEWLDAGGKQVYRILEPVEELTT